MNLAESKETLAVGAQFKFYLWQNDASSFLPICSVHSWITDQSGRVSNMAFESKNDGWVAARQTAEQELLASSYRNKMKLEVEEQLRRKHRFFQQRGQ